MKRNLPFLALFCVAAQLFGCGPDLESARFDAYFYYPSDREVYLGEVEGISACQEITGEYADKHGLLDDDWDYICCLKSRTSDCVSKHK